jgi:hypothetical protein
MNTIHILPVYVFKIIQVNIFILQNIQTYRLETCKEEEEEEVKDDDDEEEEEEEDNDDDDEEALAKSWFEKQFFLQLATTWSVNITIKTYSKMKVNMAESPNSHSDCLYHHNYP